MHTTNDTFPRFFGWARHRLRALHGMAVAGFSRHEALPCEDKIMRDIGLHDCGYARQSAINPWRDLR